VADHLDEALKAKLRAGEEGFAERSGEIFRTVINLETHLTLLDLKEAEAGDFQTLGQDEWVGVVAPFVKGLSGQVVFLLDKAFTARVVDYMIMGDGEVDFMPEEHLDGIVEAINQLMGNELTVLSTLIGISLRNEVNPARLLPPDELAALYTGWQLASFEVRIDGREPVRMYRLLSPNLALELAPLLGRPLEEIGDSDEDFGVRPRTQAAPAAAEAPTIPMPQAAPAAAPSMGHPSGPAPSYAAPAPMAPPKDMRQAQFTDFGPGPGTPRGNLEQRLGDQSLGRVMDLRLPVVIELGRKNMLIKDIVELGPGSVIELNKLVGEPVDLFVNGKRFAQGEVVVIDENFGVRVTDLVPLEQRSYQAGE
jgi:flagellar motor switch protein FliN/FliY